MALCIVIYLNKRSFLILLIELKKILILELYHMLVYIVLDYVLIFLCYSINNNK